MLSMSQNVSQIFEVQKIIRDVYKMREAKMRWLAVTNLGVIKVNAEKHSEAEREAWKLAKKGEEIFYIVPEDSLINQLLKFESREKKEEYWQNMLWLDEEMQRRKNKRIQQGRIPRNLLE
jgi:hypothetical protein